MNLPHGLQSAVWYSDPRLSTVVNHVYIHLSVSTSVVYNHIGIFHHTVYVLVLSLIAVMLPYAIRPLSVCLCCLSVGWIKVPLGMEVGLGPGHIALDWDQTPQIWHS